MPARHCAQCNRELTGPFQTAEIHFLTAYTPRALCLCALPCLVEYLRTAPAHREQFAGLIAALDMVSG